jgi:large conductance mechanosensitive channel
VLGSPRRHGVTVDARRGAVIKGFKNFLMRGDVVVVAIGLVVALAFSTLIKAFTDSVINPIVARAEGGKGFGLGWQLGKEGNKATFVDMGTFISAIIYFIIFIAVIYFAIVLPYKWISAKRGAVVFGVSRDSIASHCRFRDAHDLNFTLLSDPDAKVIARWGAWGEKNMYGNKSMGIVRSTVVVGPDGRVRLVFPKVKVAGHVEAVLASLES